MRFSLSLLPAFIATVLGQGNPLPASSSAAPVAGCSGCYIIANVAQVIFADYVTTQTATVVASSGVGRNGSTVTTTYSQVVQPFSFGTDGLLNNQPVTGAYIPLSGTVVTVGGAELTSPTAYNVFTGYTEFQLTQIGGVCSTLTSAPVNLNPAVSFVLPATAGPDAVISAESAFIAGQPKLTCDVGPVVISTTVPVSVTTTIVTSSATSTPVPAAQSQTVVSSTSSSDSGASSSSSSSTSTSTSTLATSTSTVGSSTSTTTIVRTSPIIVVTQASSRPTQSIVVGAGSSLFQASPISMSFLAALFVLPGLGAWLL